MAVGMAFTAFGRPALAGRGLKCPTLCAGETPIYGRPALAGRGLKSNNTMRMGDFELGRPALAGRGLKCRDEGHICTL